MTTAATDDTIPEVPTLETDEDTDADLIGGYTGTTPPHAETSEPPADGDGATAEAGELVDEEPKYVQITEAQLKTFEDASKGLADLKDAVHRNVSGMGSKMGTLESELKKIQSATPAGHTLKVTKEHFKELGEQFPDIVEMTVAGFNRALEGVQGTAPVDVDAKVNERINAALPSIITTAEEKATIRFMNGFVPGWNETVTSDPYRAWLKTQPKEYQEKIGDSWEIVDVKGSIDKFTAFTKTTTAKPTVTPTAHPARPSRAAAAVQPRSAGAGGRGTVSTEESAMVDAYNGR